MMGDLPVRKARLEMVSKDERHERGDDLHGIFTLTLSAIGMNRGCRQAQVEEMIVDEVGSFLRFDEDKRTRRWHRDEKIVERLLLHVVFNPNHLAECQ